MYNQSYDKPLPSHTKIRYDECYAKHVLQFLNLLKYEDLQHSDTPDLISKRRSIGVEVTSAIPSKERESVTLYYEIPHEESNSLRLNDIQRIEQCGAKYNDGILEGPNGRNRYSLIYKIFEKKLVSLNSGSYQKFDSYELFIQSNNFFREGDLEELLSNFLNTSTDSTVRFTNVVICAPFFVYLFNIAQSLIRVIELDSSTQYRIATEARREVELAESEIR